MADGQRAQLFASTDEERIGVDHKPSQPATGPQMQRPYRGRAQCWRTGPELQPQFACRRLRVGRIGLAEGRRRGLRAAAMLVAVGTNSYNNSTRFGPTSAVNDVTPVRLLPGRARLATSPGATGSSPRSEDDWDRRGRCLCRHHRRRTIRGNHNHFAPDQVGHQCWKSIVLAVGPSILNRDILPST